MTNKIEFMDDTTSKVVINIALSCHTSVVRVITSIEKSRKFADMNFKR